MVINAAHHVVLPGLRVRTMVLLIHVKMSRLLEPAALRNSIVLLKVLFVSKSPIVTANVEQPHPPNKRDVVVTYKIRPIA
jgi:hypothetical protein